VRIFEGITGIFQDAHFSKPVRIFEWAAHLRSRASALGYPLARAVPFSRKVLQALASASIALLLWQNESHRQTRWQLEERWT
jgi:hypothetical protein